MIMRSTLILENENVRGHRKLSGSHPFTKEMVKKEGTDDSASSLWSFYNFEHEKGQQSDALQMESLNLKRRNRATQ